MDNKSFRLYSDEYVFLRKLDVLEDTLTQRINTLSELKLSYTGEDPQVGQFIVFKDALGEYHEMVIKEVNATHSVAFNKSLWAVDSFANTAGDYVDEKRMRGGSPHAALSKLLEGTMWQVGSVSATNSADISFYHTDVFKGLLDLIDAYGIEYRTRIVMGDTGIRERYIDLAKTFGSNNGKRFTYGKDLISIEREYSPRMVYTAMHGYGKGIEKGDGYSRSITFESINGGKDYIADEDARLIYGRSDGHGGRVHNHGRVDFSDCEDPQELIKLTREALEAQLHPDVTYRVNAVDLKRYGYDFEGVALGDEVLVIDKAFMPEIRVSSRVTEMATSLTKPIEAEYQFGTFNNLLQKSMRDTAQAIDGIKANQPIWDRAGAFGQDGKLNASYLTDLFEHINGIFRAAGTYVKFSEERGILLFNAPDESHATWAMQLASSGWRVANTKKANGEWNWTTAATGDGITANVINAGVLRGGAVNFDLDAGALTINGEIAGQPVTVTLDGSNVLSIDSGDRFIGGLVSRDDGTLALQASTVGYSKQSYAEVGKTLYQAGSSASIDGLGLYWLPSWTGRKPKSYFWVAPDHKSQLSNINNSSSNSYDGFSFGTGNYYNGDVILSVNDGYFGRETTILSPTGKARLNLNDGEYTSLSGGGDALIRITHSDIEFRRGDGKVYTIPWILSQIKTAGDNADYALEKAKEAMEQANAAMNQANYAVELYDKL